MDEEKNEGAKPQKAICKFTCVSPRATGAPGVSVKPNDVKLITQYDPSLPEDQRFSKATPQGSMEMVIDNPALEGFFEPGQAYLIEISRAE